MRVIALIDGEHHPSVVRDALQRVAAEHEIVRVLFVGGREKVSAGVLEAPRAHYGRDVVVGHDLAGADAQAVIDLSGDPVLTPERRLEMAAAALALGLEYRAPGMALTPPPVERVEAPVPIVAVIGTGKRTGKTAVGAHLASLLVSRGEQPVLVSMGRGGPAAPQVVPAGEPLDAPALLAIARAGSHAASDYLEDAALTGVATVGTRRCGEGPAGEVFESNVADGVRLALSLEPDVVVLEGSGSALPPIGADATVCVTRGEREAVSGLGALRLTAADLVLCVGGPEAPLAHGNVIRCVLVPEPAAPVPAGARAAVFTTARRQDADRMREALERQGIDVALLSVSLARRAELERDVDRALDGRADLLLTELKAAAIEVVAAAAERAGMPVGFLRNRVVAAPGEADLDEALWDLYRRAAAPVAT